MKPYETAAGGRHEGWQPQPLSPAEGALEFQELEALGGFLGLGFTA